jgi:CHRD domain-containing protein
MAAGATWVFLLAAVLVGGSLTGVTVMSGGSQNDDEDHEDDERGDNGPEDDEREEREFETELSGGEEVPMRSTDAEGEAEFELSEDGMSLRYELKVEDISNVFMAHIHQGPFGENGPIVVWLYPSTAPTPGPTGGGPIEGEIATGVITAADFVGPLAGQPFQALIDAIEAGNAYVNVHTNDGVDPANTGPGDFPGGEIRGQLRVED